MAYKEELHPLLEKAVEHIENIIIGKRDIAILSLAAILAKGMCCWKTCRESEKR